jgi:hypothetical protein
MIQYGSIPRRDETMIRGQRFFSPEMACAAEEGWIKTNSQVEPDALNIE